MKAAVPVFYLDLPSAAASVGLSETTVQQLVRQNEFPQPRELSARRVGWLVREVQEWSEARPVSKMLPPPNTGAKKPKKCDAN